ncbi:unnamed protein product [Schistosoma curassoni]|uniref:Retrotran_gag_3 domain-containing protein n=1 Tax=Schistosoma curassoni TaxID=6186 RepID=A0A183JXY5_9TREM|nr:unnamed protein product [Schistosoma curassoni]
MSSPTKLIDMDLPPVTTFVSLSNSPENNFSSVNSISEFRLPTYGANNPRVWFAQIEALFMARGMRSQATKYAYVVGLLPIEIAAEVWDLIDHVRDSEPYDKIKAAVIQRTSVSDEKRLQQLFGYMKQLAGP